MSFTRVDLPDPLTPVTATKFPSGNVTEIFLRLFSLASFTVIVRVLSYVLRSFGMSIFVRPAM